MARERAIVLCGLIVTIAAAWAYLLSGAGMQSMPSSVPMDMGGGMMMDMPVPWTPAHFAVALLMWATMMVAMMLPGAAPAILLVAALSRARAGGAALGARAAAFFTVGYLAVWFAFSLMATALQWGLDRATALSPAMALGSGVAAGAVLFATGIYQWTPLKETCLKSCSNPTAFLTKHWRSGDGGAFGTGIRHGLYCLGCCWLLMALLFVTGIMNVVWIGGIALLVLLEKTLPWRRAVTYATGGALVVWGGALAFHVFHA